MESSLFPITDLHCDLLLYLALIPNAHINAVKDIGVTLPYLRTGKVGHQVLAIFSKTNKHSVEWGKKQLAKYLQLLELSDFQAYTKPTQETNSQSHIRITLAIENASVLALEDEPITKVFKRLDQFLYTGKRLFYITLTHHTENRFGGGNYSEVGLKPDGERLLEYMAEHQITADLSHTSYALAEDLLTYIDQHNLKLPVIASHSNFRALRNHPRNLTNEFVEEINRRKGLIGVNFLRLFLDGERPESLLEHIRYGLENAPNAIAFGADFFYRPGISDPDRQPLFFPEYEDAGQYPKIIQQLQTHGIDAVSLQQLSNGNVQRFIQDNW